jgi:hypothetical protein
MESVKQAYAAYNIKDKNTYEIWVKHEEFHGYPVPVVMHKAGGRSFHIDKGLFKTLRLLLELEENDTLNIYVTHQVLMGKIVALCTVERSSKRAAENLLCLSNAAISDSMGWERDEEIEWSTVYMTYLSWQNKGNRLLDELLIYDKEPKSHIEMLMKRRTQYLMTEHCPRESKVDLIPFFRKCRLPKVFRRYEFDYEVRIAKEVIQNVHRVIHMEAIEMDIASYFYSEWMVPVAEKWTGWYVGNFRGYALANKKGIEYSAQVLSSGQLEVKKTWKPYNIVCRIDSSPFMFLQFLILCETDRQVSIGATRFASRPDDLVACLHVLTFKESSMFEDGYELFALQDVMRLFKPVGMRKRPYTDI